MFSFTKRLQHFRFSVQLQISEFNHFVFQPWKAERIILSYVLRFRYEARNKKKEEKEAELNLRAKEHQERVEQQRIATQLQQQQQKQLQNMNMALLQQQQQQTQAHDFALISFLYCSLTLSISKLTGID